MLTWPKKAEHYKVKKHIFFESIYRNVKNNYKIWWYWNQKTNKRTISIKNIDINKIVVSNSTI